MIIRLTARARHECLYKLRACGTLTFTMTVTITVKEIACSKRDSELAV